MSYPDTPEDPDILDIVSVSYGSHDYTAYVRTQFEDALNQNPSIKTWSFPANNDFLKPDPNPNVGKACAVVYRNTFANPDGSVVWSNFKSVGVAEGGTVSLIFDGANDAVWIPPARPVTSQFIVAAYWYNSDVTGAAVKQFLAAPWIPGADINLNVSVGSLGPDPNEGTSKQFSVTYADWVFPGVWQFSLRIDLQATASWNLSIPVHFPPRDLSWLQGSNIFLKTRNEDTAVDVYPLIYDATTSELIWDGRMNDCLVPHGTTQCLNLIQLGCRERSPYFFAYVSVDGTKLIGDATYTIFAVSSSSGTPATMYWRKMGDGTTQVGHDFVDTSGPTYNPRNLRLNIYMASWGSKDYTDLVRQQYVTSTMANPPTDTSNSWSITASLATFGKDPNTGVGKSCVIIYKLGYCVGYTEGQVSNLNDPVPGDPKYSADNVRSVLTSKYPVINDVSGFLFSAAREGEAAITFDLLQLLAHNTPMVWPGISIPNIYYPLVAKAIYANLDVTAYVQNLVNNAWSRVLPAQTTVPVNVTTMTGNKDPWAGNNNQMTILIGYNMHDIQGSYQWINLLAMNGNAPWTMTIPSQPSAQPAQWPPTFTAYRQPSYNTVVFNNATSLNCWPQIVVDGGQVVWDGKKQVDTSKWKIATGQQKSVSLINDLNLVEGKSYSVTFTCDVDTYIPFAGWMVASSVRPQFQMSLTYLPDPNQSESGRFEIVKEIAYLGL